MNRSDADQVARDVVTLRQPVEGLAGQELLGELTLEFDAVRSVLHHGFHPSKARHAGQFTSANLSRPKGPLQSGVPFQRRLTVQADQQCKRVGIVAAADPLPVAARDVDLARASGIA